MTLRLPDHWVWDFWLARDGADVHAFFLHAPRALGDPGLRHAAARIGHAVSRDLRAWTVLPRPLGEPPPAAPDDLAQWTGSVLRGQDAWHLFYTGLSTVDGGRAQRVLHATSADLLTWRREPLVLEADPRWYETDAAVVHWRDPWVVRDGDTWRLLVTARSNSGPLDERGVVGHASSPDLRTWTVEPPLAGPRDFRQLEVPQVERIGGRWRLFFSAYVTDHSDARAARVGGEPVSGTHYLDGDTITGPWRVPRDEFLLGDTARSHYAARVVEHDGAWQLIAWVERDRVGRFVGELTDPVPLRVAPDGSLHVN